MFSPLIPAFLDRYIQTTSILNCSLYIIPCHWRVELMLFNLIDFDIIPNDNPHVFIQPLSPSHTISPETALSCDIVSCQQNICLLINAITVFSLSLFFKFIYRGSDWRLHPPQVWPSYCSTPWWSLQYHQPWLSTRQSWGGGLWGGFATAHHWKYEHALCFLCYTNVARTNRTKNHLPWICTLSENAHNISVIYNQ